MSLDAIVDMWSVCVVLCGCAYLNVFSFQPFLIPIKKFAPHTEYFANPGVVLQITASQNLTFNYKIKNVICFKRSLAYRVEGIYLNNASSDSRSFLNLTCRFRIFVNPELASQMTQKVASIYHVVEPINETYLIVLCSYFLLCKAHHDRR